LKSNSLLESDHVPDRAILDCRKLVRIDLAFSQFVPRLDQFGRTQKATNMIGPERGF
jgi:hypothetical protein